MESTKTSFRLLLVTVIGELDECVLAFGGHVARVLAFGGHVARVGEERGGCIGSWWGDRRELPLGRPRRKCVVNIRMDL